LKRPKIWRNGPLWAVNRYQSRFVIETGGRFALWRLQLRARSQDARDNAQRLPQVLKRTRGVYRTGR
jgi:hypothetical protein